MHLICCWYFLTRKLAGTDQKAGRPQKRVKILQGVCDWKAESDLSGGLVFPVAAAITRLHPDLVIWPDAARVPIIGELTVPWEEHMQEANENKKTKYTPHMTECGGEAVAGTLFPIWSWLSWLCGNFFHDVPPQAWHHPPWAQVCMQGCIKCCVKSLNMDLGQAQKWSLLMSSGTSQEWF